MANFLEQLVGEWYEYKGYFIRRNVLVGKLEAGGYQGELDVVAFHPKKRHFVHVEVSSDADSWARREERYRKKFKVGRQHAHELFSHLDIPKSLDQIALLLNAGARTRTHLAGGRIMTGKEFMQQIRDALPPPAKGTVHEQFSILKGLQFAAYYWNG
ncbi:MAG: hypothetical protein ACE5FO_11115 [Parvularculaceae bacterium]